VDADRPRLLVVDDEPQILRALESILSKAYDVQVAASGEEAIQFAAENPPDLVILDLALPGVSGMEITRILREWLKSPILILSVRDAEATKICALDLGADDYLTKPFLAGELLAHVRALLRRGKQAHAKPGEVRSGDLVVDLTKRAVFKGGEAVKLTRIEYALLATLAASADRVVTSKALTASVWGESVPDDNRALRVHVSNLRAKIEREPSLPQHVVTEPGLGYRFMTQSL
jgi:two-component system KDP operon response regulator KdpE